MLIFNSHENRYFINFNGQKRNEMSTEEQQLYSCRVHDGQFSFDFTRTGLPGKEGDIIQASPYEGDPPNLPDGPHFNDVYILYIEGDHVECIGNIEGKFPKDWDEHNEMKNRVIKLNEAFKGHDPHSDLFRDKT